MVTEQTLVIVKPDGLMKGLVGLIIDSIHQHGLTVVDSARVQLTRQWVEEMYKKETGKPHFEPAVSWVSSAPVLILVVEGINAVSVVKQQIIGKYPEGIRGRHSEDQIRNVAHASDSIESSQRELNLAKQILERSHQVIQDRLTGRMIFALTGMSECGKSTVGKYLDSRGIPRLKIVKLFGKVRDKQKPGMDLAEFVKQEEQRDPHALWDAFIEELLVEMDSRQVSIASIESLYGGGLGPYLMQQLTDHFCIVFIDADEEHRLRFQMIRESLSDPEEAKRLLRPRDQIKVESGIPALKDIAGEVIRNTGTLDELYRAVDELVIRHHQEE